MINAMKNKNILLVILEISNLFIAIFFTSVLKAEPFIQAKSLPKAIQITIEYSNQNLQIIDIQNSYAFPTKRRFNFGPFRLSALNNIHQEIYLFQFDIPNNIIPPHSPEYHDTQDTILPINNSVFSFYIPFENEIRFIRLKKNETIVSQHRVTSTANTYVVNTSTNTYHVIGNCDSLSKDCLDIVFIGDDYTQQDLSTFASDVLRLGNEIVAHPPFDDE